MEIRDPIHGPIEVTPAEKQVIDHPLVQRLRRVRQLGFSETTFPGATHTRFLHSLGAMHLAGRAFDAVARDLGHMDSRSLQRARAALRLAALLHDLGHPPMSHTGEAILPLGRDLGNPPGTRPEHAVTHEQMTGALIRASDLTPLIRDAFRDLDVSPDDVACILGADLPQDPFCTDGVTILPLLRQLIAGELDVDRMDYLLRDSYFTGVTYGRFEKDWLLSHVGAHPVGDAMCLSLDSSAIFAFEDFLLSRYHMFLMVYAHHKTLAYHRMLGRFLDGDWGRNLRLPADPVAFRDCDDEWLLGHLRACDDPWARRILTHKPLQLAVEGWDDDAAALDAVAARVRESLPSTTEWVDSSVEFSHYFPAGPTADARTSPLWVRVGRPGARRTVTPVERYSDLYVRQARRKRVMRIYCAGDDVAAVIDAVARALGPLSSDSGSLECSNTGVDD